GTARKNRRSGCPAAVVAGADSKFRLLKTSNLNLEVRTENLELRTTQTLADEEGMMKKTMMAAALATGVMFGYSGTAWTQTDQKLPVAGYAPAKDIPGARELPSPASG